MHLGVEVTESSTNKQHHLSHFKKMSGQYVVLYASQLPAAGTLSEAMLLHRGHLAKLVDELRQHWPDVSDLL